MNRFLNHRTLGLLGLVAITTQLLGACVVLPVPPRVHHRPVVVEVEPGYRYSDRYEHRHRRYRGDYRH